MTSFGIVPIYRTPSNGSVKVSIMKNNNKGLARKKGMAGIGNTNILFIYLYVLG